MPLYIIPAFGYRWCGANVSFTRNYRGLVPEVFTMAERFHKYFVYAPFLTKMGMLGGIAAYLSQFCETSLHRKSFEQKPCQIPICNYYCAAKKKLLIVGFLYAYSRYDTWCKYFASNRFLKNTSEYVSFLRFLAYPASTLTIHPRYKPYDYRTTTYTAVIQQYTKYTTVTIM